MAARACWPWGRQDRSWRFRRSGRRAKRCSNIRAEAPDGLPAGIQENREKRQDAASNDARPGVEPKQRDDVDGERKEQGAKHGADEQGDIAVDVPNSGTYTWTVTSPGTGTWTTSSVTITGAQLGEEQNLSADLRLAVTDPAAPLIVQSVSISVAGS